MFSFTTCTNTSIATKISKVQMPEGCPGGCISNFGVVQYISIGSFIWPIICVCRLATNYGKIRSKVQILKELDNFKRLSETFFLSQAISRDT